MEIERRECDVCMKYSSTFLPVKRLISGSLSIPVDVISERCIILAARNKNCAWINEKRDVLN